MTFFSLCIVLSEIIEEKWLRNVHNKQTIKYLTNSLNRELRRTVDDLQRKTEMTTDDVEQYINAAWIMEHLFKVGLQIESMENRIQKQGLITQLNVLLHSYGLPQLELIASSQDSVQEVKPNE